MSSSSEKRTTANAMLSIIPVCTLFALPSMPRAINGPTSLGGLFPVLSCIEDVHSSSNRRSRKSQVQLVEHLNLGCQPGDAAVAVASQLYKCCIHSICNAELRSASGSITVANMPLECSLQPMLALSLQQRKKESLAGMVARWCLASWVA
jgi:hypothetical protein